MSSRFRTLLAGLFFVVASVTVAHAAGLVVERSISLPDTAGRIDHLDIDLAGNRLFVAEHDNGSLDVVDLANGRVAGRITGLAGPQGVAYLPDAKQIAVGNGDDGSVRFFDASSLVPGRRVELGGDADNLRVEPNTQQVVVGYGDGGLAIISRADLQIVSKIALGAHPESFQLDPDGISAYVNLPDTAQIGVVDLKTGSARGFPTPNLGGNFPMALETGTGMLAVAFRSPAKLALVDPKQGTVPTAIDICADADDVFFDAKRSLLYVTCGAGYVAVVQQTGDQLKLVDNVPTGDGARTGLFVPALDRLFVAVPARNGTSAQIIVLKPSSDATSTNAGPGDAQTRPPQGANHADLGQFVGGVVDDVNAFWTKYFASNPGNGGYVAPEAYTAPEVVSYAGQTQSGCGPADRNSGSFYCPRDAKIYLDAGSYQALRGRFNAAADLSEAYVIAHEVGHHVQNLLGILPTFNKRRATMSRDQADAYSAGIELQADCFAGLSARGEQRFLDNGDIDKAIDAAGQIGDDMLTRDTTSPRTSTHGTTAQRSQWFKTGLNSTDIGQCDTGIPKPWAYYQP